MELGREWNQTGNGIGLTQELGREWNQTGNGTGLTIGQRMELG